MDRAYFQLIEAVNDSVLLATAIAKNANYKPEIMKATDALLVDTIKSAQLLNRTLQEVIRRQLFANGQTITE